MRLRTKLAIGAATFVYVVAPTYLYFAEKAAKKAARKAPYTTDSDATLDWTFMALVWQLGLMALPFVLLGLVIWWLVNRSRSPRSQP